MMKTILTTAIILPVFGAATAHAQSFTFESKSSDPLVIGGVGPSGFDYVGAYWTAKNTGRYEDGSQTTNNSVCVSMRQPPSSQIFDSHVACEVTASDGTFSTVFGCTVLNAATNEMSCVGGMRGKSGAYVGRTGSVTNHVKNDSSKGTGQWHEK